MDPTTGAEYRPSRAWPVISILLVVLPLLLAARWLSGGLEAAPPSRGDIPDLPAGLSVTNEETFCGSESCWIEQRIVGPAGTTGQDLATRLAGIQGCRNRGWFDRRELCVQVEPRGDTVSLVVSLAERF